MKDVKRLHGVQESLTLKLNALAQKLKREGKNIINLSAGEPDFQAPKAANEAVKKALDEHWSKYTPTAGLMELRERVAKFTQRDQVKLNGIHTWTPSEVLITNGGKQGVFNSILSLVEAGDEVLIPAPFWVSYPEIVRIAEAKPVILETSFKSNFKITSDQLENAITPSTSILILNSPSNPSGTAYSEKEFRGLGEVLRRHPQVWVISDEIYLSIQYGEKSNYSPSFLQACPDLWNRTVTANGLSKIAALTGWRIGWTVAPKELTDRMIALQGHATSGISSLSQAAAIAVLDLPAHFFEPNRQEFEARRELALAVLSHSGKIKVFAPDRSVSATGAFYLWIDVQDALRKGEDTNAFAEDCLQEAEVAVVPGTAFGAPTFIRISTACDRATLEEGCKRLVAYCNH